MRKKRHIKNTWYYWLINYIVETTRKTVLLKKKLSAFLRQTHLKIMVKKLYMEEKRNQANQKHKNNPKKTN